MERSDHAGAQAFSGFCPVGRVFLPTRGQTGCGSTDGHHVRGGDDAPEVAKGSSRSGSTVLSPSLLQYLFDPGLIQFPFRQSVSFRTKSV